MLHRFKERSFEKRACGKFYGAALSEYLYKCCAMCLNYKEFALYTDIWESAKELNS